MEIRFFICGTPSDRDGFVYQTLSQNPLPGNPSQYLDRFMAKVQSDSVDREERGFLVGDIDIERSVWTFYSEYCSIHPSDRDYNRGAYLAVGFLFNREPSVDILSQSIDVVSRIIATLESRLDSRRAFKGDFDLRQFRYPVEMTDEDSPLSPRLLAEILFQSYLKRGTISSSDTRHFLKARYSNNSDVLKHFQFFQTPKSEALIQCLTKEIEELKSELVRKDTELGKAQSNIHGSNQLMSRYEVERNELELAFKSLFKTHRDISSQARSGDGRKLSQKQSSSSYLTNKNNDTISTGNISLSNSSVQSQPAPSSVRNSDPTVQQIASTLPPKILRRRTNSGYKKRVRRSFSIGSFFLGNWKFILATVALLILVSVIYLWDSEKRTDQVLDKPQPDQVIIETVTHPDQDTDGKKEDPPSDLIRQRRESRP